MARPHSAARRGYSTGQVPNLSCWENTSQNAQRMHNSSRSTEDLPEDLYMNKESMESAPRVRGRDEVDAYKFYSLAELTSTFELPQSTRVVEGHCGPTETSEISQDSVLLVCFKKETKVVLADDGFHMTYSIPRDSSLMYIPLDPTYGLQGHVYNSVEEILSCSELPKAVHIDAQTAFTLRLHSGDQLIFPARKEPNTFGKCCLVCYDQWGNKFNLPATQSGSFSTKPDNIRMYMDDCITFVRKFPIRVAICDINSTMPPGTDGTILTLTVTKNEQSVVAKSKVEGHAAKLIEIPLDIPIKLQCLQTSQQRNEAEAREAFETYQNSGVENHCSMAMTENSYELQNQLYVNVKPQVSAAQLEKYITIRRQVTSAVENSSKQRRHTTTEPLYENLVDHQTLPQKPPKPQKSLTVDDGRYHARSRQSTSLPTLTKLSTQDMNNTAPPKLAPSIPPTKPTHNVVPPKVVPKVPQSQPPTRSIAPPKGAPSIPQSQPPTHNVVPPKEAPRIPQSQPPTRNVVPPKEAPRIPQSQPLTRNVPPPKAEQPPARNTNRVEVDQQNEDIYTVIPSTEPEEDPDDYVHVITPPIPKVDIYQQQQQQQQKQIQKLEASNKELHTRLIQTTTQLTQVSTQLAQLEASVAQLLQLVVTRKPEDNVKQLSFLDSDKVLMMLQAMGLSMYEHIFREHKVDGTKMTRLDSKKLTQYGITNPQDQTKLLDVIRGSISPLSYLLRQQSTSGSTNEDTYDNYVRFTKT